MMCAFTRGSSWWNKGLMDSSLFSARKDDSASVNCMYFDHNCSAVSAWILVRSR